MIYHLWCEHRGIDAVVVPVGVRAPEYPLGDQEEWRADARIKD